MSQKQSENFDDQCTEQKGRTFTRLLRVKSLLIITSGGILIITFQNFTSLSAEQLRPGFESAHASSPTDGTGDIRLIAPYRAQAPDDLMIASPHSGSDLGSVGQDWASRQAKLITGGADDRLLEDLNKKLNRFLSSDPELTPKDNAAGSRGPASIEPVQEEASVLMPKSFRMTSLNRMQVGFANNTQFSCSFQGSSMQIDLSHPISKELGINLRHEPSNAKSTVSINYSW